MRNLRNTQHIEANYVRNSFHLIFFQIFPLVLLLLALCVSPCAFVSRILVDDLLFRSWLAISSCLQQFFQPPIGVEEAVFVK